MAWQMNSTVALLLFGFVVLPALCILAERLWPQRPGGRTFRQGFGADLVWYAVQSAVSRVVAPLVVFAAVLPIFLLADLPLDNYWSGFGPLAKLPLTAQVLAVFVAADFLSYWQHRWFHRPALWSVHVVHHSSAELDWLSATRFHPLNEIGAQLIYVAPLIAVGFSPMAFVLLAPFTATYAVVLHANINMSFGPLRYVVASPVFHRWHHTQAEQAQNKNFAGFLPLWDVLFGTFYYPRDTAPHTFGVDEAVGAGFWRQLLHPLTAKGDSPAGAGPNRHSKQAAVKAAGQS